MRWWSSSALGAPLPRALLLLYFLGAWYESFSLLAFTSWMNEAVRMSQWRQNQYYAWTFMPWSLKPLWANFLEMFRTKRFFVLATEALMAVLLGLCALALSLPSYYAAIIALLWVAVAGSSWKPGATQQSSPVLPSRPAGQPMGARRRQ